MHGRVSPLQLIANPRRTRCLSIRAGVVTRNCIFHDLIWPVNLSAPTVAFDPREHAKRPDERPAGRFFAARTNPPSDRSRERAFKITVATESGSRNLRGASSRAATREESKVPSEEI